MSYPHPNRPSSIPLYFSVKGPDQTSDHQADSCSGFVNYWTKLKYVNLMGWAFLELEASFSGAQLIQKESTHFYYKFTTTSNLHCAMPS